MQTLVRIILVFISHSDNVVIVSICPIFDLSKKNTDHVTFHCFYIVLMKAIKA